MREEVYDKSEISIPVTLTCMISCNVLFYGVMLHEASITMTSFAMARCSGVKAYDYGLTASFWEFREACTIRYIKYNAVNQTPKYLWVCIGREGKKMS